MKGRRGKGGINWSERKLAMHAAAQRRNSGVPPPGLSSQENMRSRPERSVSKGPPSRFRTLCLSSSPLGLSGHRTWYKDVARGRTGEVADVREKGECVCKPVAFGAMESRPHGWGKG